MKTSRKRILIGCLGGGCLGLVILVLLPVGYLGYHVYRAQSRYEEAMRDPEIRKRMEEQEAWARRAEEICAPEKLLSSTEARHVYEQSEFNYDESLLDVVALPGFAHMGTKVSWEGTAGQPAGERYLVEFVGALNAPDITPQREALRELLQDQEALLKMTREAIVEDYESSFASMKTEMEPLIRLTGLLGGEYVDDEELAEMFPEIGSPEEVDPYICLDQLYVHQPDEDGKVSIGMDFFCSWTVDPIGVVIREGKVVEVGIDAVYASSSPGQHSADLVDDASR